MKRFVLKIVLASLLMAVIVVGMHLVAVYRLTDEADRVYTISPDTEYLFLGSSQFGCGISQEPQFNNRVLWVSDTSILSCLMRIKELERRGQLSHLKACVVPFNEFIPVQQKLAAQQWAWYQELVVSWRYLDMLPCNSASFVWYMCRNLRCPFYIHVDEGESPYVIPLTERPESFRRKFYAEAMQTARAYKAKGTLPDWDEQLLKNYSDIFEICKLHSIRMLVVRMPMRKEYHDAMPVETRKTGNEWLEKIAGLGIETVDMPDVYEETLFYDNAHMVPPGARKFTEDLYNTAGLVISDM